MESSTGDTGSGASSRPRRRASLENLQDDRVRQLELQLVEVRERLREVENTQAELVHRNDGSGQVAVGDSENGFQMLPIGEVLVEEADSGRACWASCLDMFC